MKKTSVQTGGFVPTSSTQKRARGLRLRAAIASLSLVAGSIIGAAVVAAPAEAGQVNNQYQCDPVTGWCYQTNPPYNSAFPRSCQWNDNVHTNSGMWYTGCTPGYWLPYIH